MLETMNFAHCSCAKLLIETSIHRNSRTLWKRWLAANPGNSSGTNYKAIDREHLENVIERTSLSSAMGQWHLLQTLDFPVEDSPRCGSSGRVCPGETDPR